MTLRQSVQLGRGHYVWLLKQSGGYLDARRDGQKTDGQKLRQKW